MSIDDLFARIKAALRPPALCENLTCAAILVVFLLFFFLVDALLLQRAPAAYPAPPPERTNSILYD